MPKTRKPLPQRRRRPYNSTSDLTRFERAWYVRGITHIAGVDEVGRGCLAGPVVAASVILPEGCVLEGLKDSKQLTPLKRERYYELILARACAWSVGQVEAPEIDRINIHQATLKAMRAAVAGLAITPECVLIDGPHRIATAFPEEPIVKGDSLSQSIAAASVVAKVTRDRLMCALHTTYPQFSFHVHKGYGTKAHLGELRMHGPTPLHRMTFRGVIV